MKDTYGNNVNFSWYWVLCLEKEHQVRNFSSGYSSFSNFSYWVFRPLSHYPLHRAVVETRQLKHLECGVHVSAPVTTDFHIKLRVTSIFKQSWLVPRQLPRCAYLIYPTRVNITFKPFFLSVLSQQLRFWDYNMNKGNMLQTVRIKGQRLMCG